MFWSVVLVAVAQQPGLMSQVVPSPTGKNGYEEYVRAAELIDTPEFTRWRSLGSPPADGTAPVPPSGLSSRSSLLERNRWVLGKYRAAMELVRQGNAKPVVEPRDRFDPDTTFVELGPLRNVTRAMVAAAYAEFAAGQTAEGTARLMQALVMADNVSGTGPAIGHLVGLAQEQLVYAELNARLGQLAKADCRQIDAVATELLARPSAVARVYETERAMAARIAELVTQEPNKWIEGGMLREALGKMPLEERARFRRTVESILQERYGPLIQALRGPESRWPMTHSQPVETRPKPDDTEGIAEAFVEAISADLASVAIGSARARTQLRLLRLHARILAYKWENGRLPARLLDASDDVADPLSGQPFAYEVIGDAYRLYSRGRPETGEVTLKRSLGGPAQEDPAPPVAGITSRPAGA